MKTTITKSIVAALLLSLAFTTQLHAQTTAFTYQGRLDAADSPANGLYDLRFELSTNPTNSIALGVITNTATEISNGLFTVTLDFGPAVFDGSERWLEIGVTTNGGGTFTTLSPRQLITATPYAIRAVTISSNALASYGSAVSFANPANTFSGTFTGDGSSLSNINVSTLGGLSASNIWQLGGNAGTTAGVDFLGTTDDQALELRVNNMRAMRFEENGDGNDFGTIPDGAPNVIGGSPVNFVGGGVVGATIAGGGATNWGGSARSNAVLGDYGTIGGGFFNAIESNAMRTTIAGGSHNSIGPDSEGSTLGGGVGNGILSNAYAATIAGGQQNQILANTDHGVIGGGFFNYIWPDSPGATIAGGVANLIRSNAYASAIGGGSNNFVFDRSEGATIAGGGNNYIGIASDYSAIGGGRTNSISSNSVYATISGGWRNNIGANSFSSTVAGGQDNRIEPGTSRAVIGGGELNTIGIGSDISAIGGGWRNSIGGNSFYNTISGGHTNVIGNNAHNGVIAGGHNNSIGQITYGAVIGGGGFNDIAVNAEYAVVPGGFDNDVGPNADGAFAAGRRAKANHAGTFVWADSTDADFASTAADQFLIRASGGVGIGKNNPATSLDVNGTVTATAFAGDGSGLTGLNIPDGHSLDASDGSPVNAVFVDSIGEVGIGTTSPATALDVNGDITSDALVTEDVTFPGTFAQKLTLYSSDFGIGVQAFTTYFRSQSRFAWFDEGVHANGAYDPGAGGTVLMTLDATGLTVNGTFVSSSDRNQKERFAAVDPAAILDKVVSLPLSTWHYKQDPETRHVGPVAQDFHAAFGVGPDDKHIATVDADGVALAAIQGLNQKLEENRAENAALRSELQEIKQLLSTLTRKGTQQ